MEIQIKYSNTMMLEETKNALLKLFSKVLGKKYDIDTFHQLAKDIKVFAYLPRASAIVKRFFKYSENPKSLEDIKKHFMSDLFEIRFAADLIRIGHRLEYEPQVLPKSKSTIDFVSNYKNKKIYFELLRVNPKRTDKQGIEETKNTLKSLKEKIVDKFSNKNGIRIKFPDINEDVINICVINVEESFSPRTIDQEECRKILYGDSNLHFFGIFNEINDKRRLIVSENLSGVLFVKRKIVLDRQLIDIPNLEYFFVPNINKNMDPNMFDDLPQWSKVYLG